MWKVACRADVKEDEKERKLTARELSCEMASWRGAKEAMWTLYDGRRRNSWATARQREAWPSSLLVKKRMVCWYIVEKRRGVGEGGSEGGNDEREKRAKN